MVHKPNQKRRPFSPTMIVAGGFAILILLVTVLLMLPVSSADGSVTPPLSALFTATSAVCVTGLVVVDTATHWSLFGKIVLLIALQIGGLGIMTVLGVAGMILGQKIGLRERTLLQESISTMSLGGIVRLVKRAAIGTALIEGLGMLLLAGRFVPMLGLPKGMFYALFHSVSAFCNGGFDLMGSLSGPFSSLESFVGDPLVNLTMVFLILISGLGFFVWNDLIDCRFRYKKLSLHSRLVLILTLWLVLIPSILFFLLERNASMSGMDSSTRILASLFSAVTPRTAGFDTVPTGALSEGGALLTLLLMLAGGNPGSTAGGAKVTTLFVGIMLIVTMIRREDEVHIMGRRLGSDLLIRAASILAVYLTAAFCASLAICGLQPELALRDVLLEVFSAINTVGMSTGITRALCPLSRIIIILLMYAGRLGSLTFAILVWGKQTPARIQYPADRILVG